MKRMHWLILVFSAFLYAAPMLWSSYCWPLVFVFAAPFLYGAALTSITLAQSIVWGIVAFSCHLAGVISGIDNFAKGTIIERLAPACVLVAIATTYAVIWFAVTNSITRALSIRSIEQKLALWTVSFWLFILYLEYYSFVPLGRIEGHFLFNPIFVLAEQPRLLTLLVPLGKTALTFLLIALSGAIAYACIRKTYLSYALIALLSAPWLISLMIPVPPLVVPDWIERIAYVPVKISAHANLTHQAKTAQNVFEHIAYKRPNAQLIIMPESSIFCDHLTTAPELCAHWSERDLSRPLNIILGSFRWQGPCYRNALLWFYDGKLQQIFDKRHAMLLTEELPRIYNIKLFKQLFFSTYPGIVPSNNERPLLDVIDGVSFIPYICSELFFNDKPDDNYPCGSTILSLTNDMWCMRSNIANLMQLSARFRAIQWQRNILYISYVYGRYFDMHGNQMPLSY